MLKKIIRFTTSNESFTRSQLSLVIILLSVLLILQIFQSLKEVRIKESAIVVRDQKINERQFLDKLVETNLLSNKKATTTTKKTTTTEMPTTASNNVNKNEGHGRPTFQLHQNYEKLWSMLELLPKSVPIRETLLLRPDFNQLLQNLTQLEKNSILANIFLGELDYNNRWANTQEKVDAANEKAKPYKKLTKEDLQNLTSFTSEITTSRGTKITIDSFAAKKLNIQAHPLTFRKYDYEITSDNPENPQILRKRLPNVICIGAKKCGTGAFLNFIQHHSKFKTSKINEIHFYDGVNLKNGLSWYLEQFPEATPSDLLYEKTPRYLPTIEAPERVYNIYKNFGSGNDDYHKKLKIVVILCNPSLRTYSDYVHTLKTKAVDYRIKSSITGLGDFTNYTRSAIKSLNILQQSRTPENYTQAINLINNNSYRFFNMLKYEPVTKGLYLNQIENWLKYFNQNQLILINGDKLLTDPGEEMVEAQRKMNIDIEITEDSFVKNPRTGMFCYTKDGKANLNLCLSKNKGRTKSSDGSSSMPDEAKSLLDEYFAPYNQKLYKLIHQVYDW